jgi:hypothetical protein
MEFFEGTAIFIGICQDDAYAYLPKLMTKSMLVYGEDYKDKYGYMK